MATAKSDPVVSCITLISAGSTITYFVVVSGARTQNRHSFLTHWWVQLLAQTEWWWSELLYWSVWSCPVALSFCRLTGTPMEARARLCIPVTAVEAAVLGTCLHCAAGTSLLGGQSSPASVSRAPDVPGINFCTNTPCKQNIFMMCFCGTSILK